MITKLTVFKEVHNSWDANDKRKAGEAWDLLCLDVSDPAEHRMEEMLYYRLKPEERVASVSIDPERDEVVYDDERGENCLRKTPMGMLEEAKAEANQRELADYRDTISLLRQKGFSFREIGEFLSKRGVFADHNAVYRVYTKHMTSEEMEEENRIQEEEREQEIQQ